MDFEFIVFLIIILIVIVPICSFFEKIDNINNYDISNAILIDNFVTYNKSGFPCYYLVYKFEDNSIKEFNVNEEIYYKNK